MVVTGVRPGEMMGIKWSDIDGDMLNTQRSINVHREQTRGKNDNAARSFVLPTIAQRILADQRAMLEEAKVQSDYVFCDVNGEPPRENKLNKHLAKYCEYNEIQRVTPYELRHTWFSLNKALPPELVKMMGGHSEGMDTFGTYGHLVDGEQERMAVLVDDVMRGVLDSEDGPKSCS